MTSSTSTPSRSNRSLLQKAKCLTGWVLIRALGLALLCGIICAIIALGFFAFLLGHSFWAWITPITGWQDAWKVIVSIGVVVGAGVGWFLLILHLQTRSG